MQITKLVFSMITIILLSFNSTRAQIPVSSSASSTPGMITDSVLDADNGKAIAGATIQLTMMVDSLFSRSAVTVKDGALLLNNCLLGSIVCR